MYKNNVIAGLGLLAAASFSAQATIVEVHTNHGRFQINLHDQTTPQTVENFLKYVEEGRFINTVIHRAVTDFVIQSGGYVYEGKVPLDPIEVFDAVENEPLYSNVRGTIAMAKIPGYPDSATSQWFINLSDNSAGSAALDTQNGGFTVFGEVIMNGMDIIDDINNLPLCGDIPMPEVSDEDCQNSDFVPGYENFVVIENVVVVDSSPTTAESLTPVMNTAINQPPAPDPDPEPQPNPQPSGGSSSGSLSWLSLLGLSLLSRSRRR